MVNSESAGSPVANRAVSFLLSCVYTDTIAPALGNQRGFHRCLVSTFTLSYGLMAMFIVVNFYITMYIASKNEDTTAVS